MSTRYGDFLSSEEHPLQELARQGRLAEEAGFEALGVSEFDREAGFDEVCIGQVGPDAEGFFEFNASHVLPRLREG